VVLPALRSRLSRAFFLKVPGFGLVPCGTALSEATPQAGPGSRATGRPKPGNVRVRSVQVGSMGGEGSLAVGSIWY
jgi:hypothetical protein